MKKNLLAIWVFIPLSCFGMHRHMSDSSRNTAIEVTKDNENRFLEFQAKKTDSIEHYAIHKKTASYIAYFNNKKNELLLHNGSAWQRTPEQSKFTQIGNTAAASLLTSNQAARVLEFHKHWNIHQKTNPETSHHRQLAALVKAGDSSLSRHEQLAALVKAGTFETSKFDYLNETHPRLGSKDIIQAFKEWFGLESKDDPLITMPNEEVLKERLFEMGMDHFAEKTKIVKHLANQELTAGGVLRAIDLAIQDYIKDLQKSTHKDHLVMRISLIKSSRSSLVKALLKDAPKLLDELKGYGLL